MSIEQTKKKIISFLKDSESGCLALKGAWGTGKTYLWNELLKTEKKDDFKFENYAYLSLFGISSTQQIKFNICSTSVDKTNIGEKLTLENILEIPKEKTKKYNWWRGLFTKNRIKKLSTKGIASYARFFSHNNSELLTALTFNYLENTLICLDDYDRKNEQLNTNDILGLISYLKEQRDCKIVLIFNESTLNNTEKQDYAELREKVIDFEIEFSPTVDEVIELVFNNESKVEQNLKSILTPFLKKLAIRNIRILNKIKQFTQEIVITLGNYYEPGVIDQAIGSSTLLAWSFYSRKENAPEYEFVKTFNRDSIYKQANDTEKDKREANWAELLNNYGFFSCDDFDAEIALSLERNYIDKEQLNKLAIPINLQKLSGKSKDLFYESYEKIHSRFDPNIKDLAANLLSSFNDNIEFLNPIDLDITTRMLNFLDKEISTNDLIDSYIAKNSHRPSIFNLDSFLSIGEIKDQTLIEKFDNEFKKNKTNETFENIFIRVSETNSWNPYDIEVLG
jgi:hypothetical protein